MSIISDALKKATEKKVLPQGSTSPILSKFQKGVGSSGRNWLVWAGLGLVCFAGLLVVVNLVKGPAEPSLSRALSPQTQSAFRFDLRNVDFDDPVNNGRFRLSGIVYDADNPLAIINNGIVAEGAFVDGAQLLEIQPSYVKLTFKGKEFRLQVR